MSLWCHTQYPVKIVQILNIGLVALWSQELLYLRPYLYSLGNKQDLPISIILKKQILSSFQEENHQISWVLIEQSLSWESLHCFHPTNRVVLTNWDTTPSPRTHPLEGEDHGHGLHCMWVRINKDWSKIKTTQMDDFDPRSSQKPFQLAFRTKHHVGQKSKATPF